MGAHQITEPQSMQAEAEPQSMQQRLVELKGEIGKSAVTVAKNTTT